MCRQGADRPVSLARAVLPPSTANPAIHLAAPWRTPSRPARTRLLPMRTTPLLLAAVTSLLAQAVFAQAEPDADARARELYDNGALLYEEGDYENAIVAWKGAYELSPRPLLLFNIANALERVGEWQEAYDYISRYRAYAPADERDTLDRRMRAIERRIEEKRREDARLAAEQATSHPQATAGAGELTPTPVASKQEAAGPHPAPFVLLGAGLAGLGVGGVFGGLALGARDDAEAVCTAYGDGVLCPDTAEGALLNDRRWSTASDIGLVAGGATAATGMVLVIVDAALHRKPSASALRVVPVAGPSGGALTLVARF